VQVTITKANKGDRFTYDGFELKITYVNGDTVGVANRIGSYTPSMSIARLEQGFADGVAYWGHYNSSVADIVRSSGGSVSGESNGSE